MMRCDLSGSSQCDGKCYQHCAYTLSYHSQCRLLLQQNYPEWKMSEQHDKLTSEWIDHLIECHNFPDTRIKKYPNGKYKGPFAFTLTMSPSDGLTEQDMMMACRKLMTQRSQPVKKFSWYLEYKDTELKTHPHIHGMYECEDSCRIQKRTWERMWPVWNEGIPLGAGFRGGYHRPVRSDEGYANYIVKQGGIGESNI